jgi:DNA polymerase-3 subunit delta'
LIPSDIIYQTRAWSLLSRSFKAGKTAGTYLFYGPEGVGRWQLAISFGALLNCEKPVLDAEDRLPRPCGECRNCRNIFALRFEGLHFAVPIPPHGNKADNAIDLTGEIIDRKREEPFSILSSESSTNIPVSVAREIKKRLGLRSSEGMTRVVIFYQMERMKTASTDALLKLIEEPPADTVMILISRKPDSLLPTIQSRSLKLRADMIPSGSIEQYLIEHYEVSEKKAKLLARIAEGSIGRAIDMIEESKDESSLRSVIFLLFKSLFLDSSPDLLGRMQDVMRLNDRSEAEELLRVWQGLIRDCAYFAVTGDEEGIANIDFSTDIRRLASRFSDPQTAPLMVGEIKNTLEDLRRNVHIPGALMALALRLKRTTTVPVPV